jgi:hypothetical protein
MTIKVSDNSIQVAKNFEKQIREQPLIVKKALGRTAEFLIFLIKTKTKKGVDYQGNSFAKYTKAYAESLEKKSGKGTRPDLLFSGNMLSSITQKSFPTFAEVYFADKTENTKAINNQSKRKFFAIGERDVNSIMNVFSKEFNTLRKI